MSTVGTWQCRWRWAAAVWAVAAVVGASQAPAEPYILLDSAQQWHEALQGSPPLVQEVQPQEWMDYMMQWGAYGEPEPYPTNQFLPPELYVWGGGGGGGGGGAWPEDAGLVMAWGDAGMLEGSYSSAWKFDYGLDPDLSNCLIQVTVTAPPFINVVSFGIKDVNGAIRAWYWNCGPGQPIQHMVATPITINTSLLGVGAATPVASAWLNNPGFNITQAQSFIVDENAVWVGTPGIPPPGQTDPNPWNYWHYLSVAPIRDIKWDQPPIAGAPDNVYYGWNQESTWWQSGPTVADDWVCTTDDPVTKIIWWGSYPGWDYSYPPTVPDHFHLLFWTDVPAGADEAFSHPGTVIHEILCQNFTWEFVGWDFDPRSGRYEACFRYEQELQAGEWFYQEPGTADPNIYWLSVSACWNATPPTWAWGWKTRPRDPLSAAPDDAVVMTTPTMPGMGTSWVLGGGYPLYYPTPDKSWDMAFELVATPVGTVNKWDQQPDPQWPGIHAHDYIGTMGQHERVVAADQWQCGGGVVSDLHWYGNYEMMGPGIEWRGSGIGMFHLSIHYNLPGVPWCLPMEPEAWMWDVPFMMVNETFTGMTNIEGSPIYRYDIVLPQPFYQELGQIYWVDVVAMSNDPYNPAHWRWQEAGRNPVPIICPAATKTEPPIPGTWTSIRWIAPIRWSDLAFTVTSSASGEPYLKWSQPPEPYTPTNGYIGWNEYSVYGNYQIVADDWVCTTTRPVTDIHWWGSFLNWRYPWEPPQMPRAFHIGIWTDVPSDPGDPSSFSHPGEMIWQNYCDHYTYQMVGWDWDPRTPDGMVQPPETCFKFEQYLDPHEWFWQAAGDNIYWVSIAAVYPDGVPPENPFGWKTRLRDLTSPAPDDAVTIYDPTAPVMGSMYVSGWPIEYPQGTSWDMAFRLTTLPQVELADFGDAPDPLYPTLLINNGARHTVVAGVFLGAGIDDEPDGQPDPGALGDDNDIDPLNPLPNFDDEDGVVFTSLVIPGQLATVDVTASVAGTLWAWMDFNGDGSWAEAGDLIFAGVGLVPGVNSLTFNVPGGAGGNISTFARFRFTTGLAILGYDGPAPDGEVEDYQVWIEDMGRHDLGDAPDSSNSFGAIMTAYPAGGPPGVVALFPTVFMAGSPPFGPLHRQPRNLAYLGGWVSLENEADVGPDEDGVNNLQPLGDVPNMDGFDDGLLMPLTLPHCRPARLRYMVTAVAAPAAPLYVNVWFDWTRNGNWNDAPACPLAPAPEWAVQNQVILPAVGPQVFVTPAFLPWHPIATPEPLPLWMRITLSEQPWDGSGGLDGGSGPPGGYEFGETEDYYVDFDYLPPSITTAVSQRNHGAAGPFDIDVINPLAGQTWPVECRTAGPTKLIVTFNEPIAAATGTPTDVCLKNSVPPHGMVNSIIVAGNVLTVNMSGTGQGMLLVTFPGITDLAGNVTMDSLCFAFKIGDVTGNRLTNSQDIVAVKNNQGPTTLANYRKDVNASGVVNSQDITATKNNQGAVVGNCPATCP